MTYYKLVDKTSKEVVAVLQEFTYILFMSHGRVYKTNKQTAQGIADNSGVIYSFISNPTRDVPIVTLHEISEEEFTRLNDLVNSDKQVIDEAALINAKTAKISELSDLCNRYIVNGFTIRLSDHNSYNFRLTTEDQLNLMAIENQLNSGENTFIYHATNEPCKVFSREDMSKVINHFKRYTLYHTTYFNVAKHYINSLKDVDKVTKFAYGDDVSEIIKDKAIKKILKTGGNF